MIEFIKLIGTLILNVIADVIADKIIELKKRVKK
jgi:hypothetical protein